MIIVATLFIAVAVVWLASYVANLLLYDVYVSTVWPGPGRFVVRVSATEFMLLDLKVIHVSSCHVLANVNNTI